MGIPKTTPKYTTEFDELMRAFSEHSTTEYQAVYQNEVRFNYPLIPGPYDTVWDRSDTEFSSNEDWHNSIRDTISSLTQAISKLENLAAKTRRMDPDSRAACKNALAEAAHKLESQIDSINFHYPLPSNQEGYLLDNGPVPQEDLPRFILDTPERIIIWTKPLPPKTEKASELVLTELRNLLYSHDLPWLQDWHCDFIHVYSPEDLIGVRDVDNYLYKPFIDALALALHTKDSYDHFSCAMYNFPSSAVKNGCYIHICKRAEKVSFFQDFEEVVLDAQNPQKTPK